MFQNLDERLSQATEQVARKEKLERRLREMENELDMADGRVCAFGERLAEEDRDVERLETLTLTSIFASIWGDKVERLDKEKQEAAAARVRFEEAKAHLAAVTKDVQNLRNELIAIGDPAQEYQQLLAEKEQLIQGHDKDAAQHLFRLAEEIQKLDWHAKQLDETIAAAEDALSALSRVKSSLRQARSCGEWDMWTKGAVGWYMTSQKHSHLDDAQHHVHRAREALARLAREMRDLDSEISIPNVELDGFSRFADYFFDGFFTDWMVQNQIDNSFHSTDASSTQVTHLMECLREKQEKVRAGLDSVRQEREEFVARFGAGKV